MVSKSSYIVIGITDDSNHKIIGFINQNEESYDT